MFVFVLPNNSHFILMMTCMCCLDSSDACLFICSIVVSVAIIDLLVPNPQLTQGTLDTTTRSKDRVILLLSGNTILLLRGNTQQFTWT